MINIEYTGNEHKLVITGHSNYAERGKDIVCSGVSVLACTMAQNLELLSNRGAIENLEIQLNDGDTYMSCDVVAGHEGEAELVIAAVLMGMVLMANSYPEYVRFIEK